MKVVEDYYYHRAFFIKQARVEEWDLPEVTKTRELGYGVNNTDMSGKIEKDVLKHRAS